MKFKAIFIVTFITLLDLIDSLRIYTPYRFDKVLNRTVDVNECDEGIHDCSPVTQTCKNLEGSFKCLPKCTGKKKYVYDNRCNYCKEGLMQIGRLCIDLDECIYRSGYCNRFTEKCVFKPILSYCEFHCQKGLIQVGKKCIDINECENGQSRCDPKRRCINNYGGYSCVSVTCRKLEVWNATSQKCECVPGFALNKMTLSCEDVNDCQNNPCGVGGQCVDLVGSYKCNCAPGYEFKNGTCEDVNECQLNQHNCKNLTCINTKGSYKCRCPKGFKDGQYKSCIDINECQKNLNVCRTAGMKAAIFCVNAIGHHLCVPSTCSWEYKPVQIANGYTCTLSNEECSFKKDDYGCQKQQPLNVSYNFIEIIPREFAAPLVISTLSLSKYNQNEHKISVKVVDQTYGELISSQWINIYLDPKNVGLFHVSLMKYAVTLPNIKVIVNIHTSSNEENNQYVLRGIYSFFETNPSVEQFVRHQ